MPEIYTECELKDDDAVIKAITNLKKLWKEQLINLRLNDIINNRILTIVIGNAAYKDHV